MTTKLASFLQGFSKFHSALCAHPFQDPEAPGTWTALAARAMNQKAAWSPEILRVRNRSLCLCDPLSGIVCDHVGQVQALARAQSDVLN